MKYNVDFSRYKNAQIVQFFTHLTTILDKHDLDSLGLTPYIDEVEQLHNDLLNSLNETSANEITAQLEIEDERRGNAYRGIKQMLEAFSLNHDPAIKRATESLLFIFNKHGEGVNRLPYSEESAVLTKLHNDLVETQELLDAITLLQLDEWVNELRTSNLAFQELFIARIESNSTQVLSTPEIRKVLISAYRTFAKQLEARDILNSSPLITQVMSVIDQLIKKSNLDVNRKGQTDSIEDESLDQTNNNAT